MRIDIEVDDWKSHSNSTLQMTWKRTGISPFFEKLILEIDPLFNLGKVGPPPHLAEEFPLIKFE